MLEHETTIAFAIIEMKRIASRIVDCGRFSVMFAEICVLTDFAIRGCEPTLFTIKLIERFRLFATRTEFHTQIVSTGCAIIMAQQMSACLCPKKNSLGRWLRLLFIPGVADRDRTGDLRNHNPTL
jgi:hypothetical protein